MAGYIKHAVFLAFPVLFNFHLFRDLIKSISRIIADPGCLSRVLIIIHAGSQILDPTTATTVKRSGQNMMSYLFCSHKYL
jgi:hypothetical protein